MVSESRHGYALCLTGSRSLNKRMSLFMEGVLEAGGAAQVLAWPRGQWSLQRFEQLNAEVQSGVWRLSLEMRQAGSLSVIFCFHWLMLPLAVVLGRLRRVPVIYDEHDHYELNTLESDGGVIRRRLTTRLIRFIHRLCLPSVSLVTCIHLANDVLKTHLQQWQPRVVELHNFPVAAWRQVPLQFSTTAKLTFVYMGGVFAEKGVGQAAEAFRSLPLEIRQQAELHVFGSGDPQLTDHLLSCGEVHVHRSVSPDALREFASARRCCGLVMYNEHPRYRLIGTNSRKLYEYLALGMPVIATGVGELPDFLRRHPVGLLVNARIDTAELANAMQRMICEPECWASRSVQARSLMMRDDMTWEHEWSKVVSSGLLNDLKKAA